MGGDKVIMGLLNSGKMLKRVNICLDLGRGEVKSEGSCMVL